MRARRHSSRDGAASESTTVTSPVADSLLGALAAVTAAFDDAGVPAVVVGGVTVRLPRVEDLMIMKAVAQRPQDMLDLEGLIAAHPQADLTVVRQWGR